MNLENAIRRHYTLACALQRDLDPKGDSEMKLIMQGRSAFDAQCVKKWMQGYGLFQGITNSERDRIVKTVSRYLNKAKPSGVGISHRAAISGEFSFLFAELYHTKNRMWLAATSKLLWCVYPDDIVMYDSFVERFVTVMQWFEDDLLSLQPLGNVPQLTSPADIPLITAYYMGYQDRVFRLFKKYRGILKELRRANHETYPHDIRIFDKILWITSKPDPTPFPTNKASA